VSDLHLQLVTPTYRPVGGVVKLIDYARHAVAKGWRVTVICREAWSPELDLAQSLGLTDAGAEDLTFVQAGVVDPALSDYVLISLPTSHKMLRRTRPMRSPERVIHIIQNVRHSNPGWLNGYALRLLTRPMARISTNAIVGDSIASLLDPRALHEVIDIGHDTPYFHLERSGKTSGPLRVAYTTWKSDVGDRVSSLMADTDLEFRAIREQATWQDLRALYHWADVFLCSPGPQEGLYLPGLEAMAAGCLVLTPDVGGNMAYCKPGANCIMVDYEDADSYAAALRHVARDPRAFEQLRTGGYATASEFSLTDEREKFHDFLDTLQDRVAAAERL
jgi:glycosyltransferase involved in cell wall biosynthesis